MNPPTTPALPARITLLHHQLAVTAARLPDRPALVAGAERLSWGELQQRVTHLAGHLQALGVQRGDRVALFMNNSLEMVAGLFAALTVGAVFMPVNAQTKDHKLAYVLDDVRARVLLTDAALQPVWSQTLQHTRHVETVLVAHAAAGSTWDDARVRTWPAADAPAPALQDPGLIDQDLAAILYTSGSTGHPKGVMLTHHAMVSASASVRDYLHYGPDDVILCALPLAFNYGLYQVLIAALVGACVVLERSFAFPVKVLEVMVREGATVFPGVPTMFSMLTGLRNLENFDLTRLRCITNAGAALPDEQLRRVRAAFPQARLYSMYGQTECTRVSYLPPEELDRRPLSVGRGMPNIEIWLADEQGRRLPHGATGELVVRGATLMRGYWERPDETDAKLRSGPVPGERVLHTGDLFRTDDEGWFYFVARQDDIIKSRGEKVSPREVEDAIHLLEPVLEVAVVGAPDPLLGQAVHAYVVLREGAALTEREVIRHCLSELESFMAPKQVHFVAALPKTDNGKIRKVGLAEHFASLPLHEKPRETP